MKKIMRLTTLAAFYVAPAWVGYVSLHFGSAVIFFFAALALIGTAGALFCAPEGYEQADGVSCLCA